VFYVGAMLVMVTLFPWNQIGTETSPFVSVFSKMAMHRDYFNFWPFKIANSSKGGDRHHMG